MSPYFRAKPIPSTFEPCLFDGSKIRHFDLKSLTVDSGFTDYLTARSNPCKRDFRSGYRAISFPVRGRQALQLRRIVHGSSVPVLQQPQGQQG